MSPTPTAYDYIIAGGGAAGLSLAWRMVNDSFFDDKRILIIDRDAKETNDRTWSFWEVGTSDIEHLVHKQWSKAVVAYKEKVLDLKMAPFAYKMVRGIDFYAHVKADIAKSNATTIIANIERFDDEQVVTDKGTFAAPTIFSSIFDYKTLKAEPKDILLWQHFKGKVIRTEQPIFEPGTIHLMDFRVEQGNEVRFVYVLPFSETEAMVEFTVFGKEIWPEQDFDAPLNEYLKRLWNLSDYTTVHKEYGVIPMTNLSFPQPKEKGVIPIGTLAGWAKASTGYTFRNIQKNVKAMIEQMKEEKTPIGLPTNKRFRLYDQTLLHVITQPENDGAQLFVNLFDKNPAERVLRFLDQESSFTDELAIMASSPTIPFVKAMVKESFR